MSYFLIVFDRRTRRITKLDEFASDRLQDALDARFECEFETRHDADVEVVLFSAESLEALQRTHSRYFFRERKLHPSPRGHQVLSGAS